MTTTRTAQHGPARGPSGRRTLTVVLGLGLAATTAAATMPAASASVSSRVLLRPATTSVIGGEAVVLTGSVTRRVARPVELQRVSGGHWVRVTSGRTSRQGAYRLTTRAARTGQTSYRAYLPRARAGGRTYAAAVSRAAVVRTVSQSGGVTVPTTSRAVGQRFTATAAFTPARPGRLTWLEARTGYTWTRVSAMVRQSSTGRVTLSSYGRKAGTTTYRAVTGALSGAAAAGTPTQTLDVTPPKTTLVHADSNRFPGGDASADGAWVVFPSYDPHLDGDDDNGIEDVFLFERATGQITRLTSFAAVPTEGVNWFDNSDTNPTISDDGKLIAYETDFATTGSRSRQIVLVDRATGATTRGSDMPDAHECTGARFSGDGSHLAFTCYDDGPHLYVRDLVAGTTQQVSTERTGSFGYLERYYELSADGRYIVYMYDLVNQDRYTVAWRDLQTGAVHRFPTPATGDPGLTGYPHLSSDGTKVGIETTQALDPRDHNGVEDAYVWNLADDSTELVSLNAAGTATGNDRSYSPRLTDDGFAVFKSEASDLVLDDTNGHDLDTFKRDLR